MTTPDQAQAVRLRLAGATYVEIARQAGYATPDAAARAIRRVLQEIPRHRNP